ncbi:MAG: MSMEG_0570 family nitrogen starvation response protein [Mycobacterium sp.]
MPEMTFTVRWPDGAVQNCYSPSLVMHDFLCAEKTYSIDDFMQRTTMALQQASERVKARYGMSCTSAAAQLDELAATRGTYDDGAVTVLAMNPGREALS